MTITPTDAMSMVAPFIVGIIGWFLRSLLSQVHDRLEKIEGKLDAAAEARGEMKASVAQLDSRLDSVERRLDKAS